MTREQMRGSWAGAMGNMQFMPSTFMKWGVDRDGNGKIDLWTSLPRRLRLGRQLPARHRLQARPAVERGGVPAAGLPARPGRHHDRKAGARLGGDGRQAAQAARRCPTSTIPRRSSCRRAGAGPAFILYPNFKAVMNWNRSTLYALAVGILARQIAGGPAGRCRRRRPTTSRLSRDTVIDLQTRLAKLGLYTDETDGLLGPKTRSRRCGCSRSRSACLPTAIRRRRRRPPPAGGGAPEPISWERATPWRNLMQPTPESATSGAPQQ